MVMKPIFLLDISDETYLKWSQYFASFNGIWVYRLSCWGFSQLGQVRRMPIFIVLQTIYRYVTEGPFDWESEAVGWCWCGGTHLCLSISLHQYISLGCVRAKY